MARSRNAWLTPDDTAQPNTVARCLAIPEPLFPMVTGALSLLTEVWNWEQFGTMTPDDAAELAAQMLENFGAQGCDTMLLRQNPENPCELQTSINGIDWTTWADMALCAAAAQIPERAQPQTVRENPTTGELEVSFDGGTTWTDYPEPAQPQPPYVPPRKVATEATDALKRCAAADRATWNLSEMYRQTYGAIGAGLTNTLSGLTNFLMDLNDALAGIVWGSYYEAATTAIEIFLGPAPRLAYFDAVALTTTAQDDLRCLLYNNATVIDGIVSFDYGAVVDNVIAEMGLNPGTATWTHLNYLGADGLNRLADTGFGSDDVCEPCEPLPEFPILIPATQATLTTVEYPIAEGGFTDMYRITSAWHGSDYRYGVREQHGRAFNLVRRLHSTGGAGLYHHYMRWDGYEHIGPGATPNGAYMFFVETHGSQNIALAFNTSLY